MIVIQLFILLGSICLCDAWCMPGSWSEWGSWSACTASCGGGVQERIRTSCVLNLKDKDHRGCSEVCYNGGTYVKGVSSCSCPGWRTGSCCSECNKNQIIPNCQPGSVECGGDPDNVKCTRCDDPYYSGGYGEGCKSCPEIITRDKWNARKPRKTYNMTKVPVKMFFIHHTDTRSCDSVSKCSRILKGIQDWHMDGVTKHKSKWDDIGYSFLIGEDGNVYEGPGWEHIGTHTYGHNSIAFAASFIGNYTDKKHKPGQAALDAAKNLIACGVHLGKIHKDYRLYGHRDVRSTACPGDGLYNEIQDWHHYGKKP